MANHNVDEHSGKDQASGSTGSGGPSDKVVDQNMADQTISTNATSSSKSQKKSKSIFNRPGSEKWRPSHAHYRTLRASDGGSMHDGNSPIDTSFGSGKHISNGNDVGGRVNEEAGGNIADDASLGAGEEVGQDFQERETADDRSEGDEPQEDRGRSHARLPNSYRRTPTPHPLLDIQQFHPDKEEEE